MVELFVELHQHSLKIVMLFLQLFLVWEFGVRSHSLFYGLSKNGFNIFLRYSCHSLLLPVESILLHLLCAFYLVETLFQIDIVGFFNAIVLVRCHGKGKQFHKLLLLFNVTEL